MKLRFCSILLISSLVLLTAPICAAQSSRTPKVSVTVSVEREDPKTCLVHWAVVNHRNYPILFPRAIAAPPADRIYTVEIERFADLENGWTTLPRNREWTHLDSNPIKLGPGETYRYSWTLPDDYMLPEGVTYPKPPYSIPLKTELRLEVTYFEDEKDWQAYLNESKALDCNWWCMEPLLKKWGHQAFSDPFKLPPAKSNPGSASPTPK